MLALKNQIPRSRKNDYLILRQLCHHAKNLYNRGLYIVRQEFFRTGKYLPYNKLYHRIKHESDYKNIPSQVGQQVLRTIHQNFISFFKLLELKKAGKYNENCRIPRYLPKKGFFLSIFPKDMFRAINGILKLSLGKYFTKLFNKRYLIFIIPPNLMETEFKQIRIIPKYKAKFLEIEYIYETDEDKPILDNSRYMGIDVGLNNFASCYTGISGSFIIEGSQIVSYNRWFNKKKSKMQSVYSHQKIRIGDVMANLLHSREMTMNDFIDQSVNEIIKNCLDNQIGNIVVGDWEDMKRNLKMRKKTSQQFQQIPYKKFKNKLKSKCLRLGINFVLIEESYTLQTCSRCGVIRKANRVKRGLYACKSCGLVINADINAAINIIRKVAPKYKIGSSGGMITPVRIRVID